MRILISPFFRRCSASRRRVRESEPWWAATCSGPRRSASAKAIFSTRRRVLTKTSVERWFWAWVASLSKISVHMLLLVTELSSSRGDFDGDVEFAALAYLDDGCGFAVWVDAGEEAGYELDGILRGGEADSLRRCVEAG